MMKLLFVGITTTHIWVEIKGTPIGQNVGEFYATNFCCTDTICSCCSGLDSCWRRSLYPVTKLHAKIKFNYNIIFISQQANIVQKTRRDHSRDRELWLVCQHQ